MQSEGYISAIRDATRRLGGHLTICLFVPRILPRSGRERPGARTMSLTTPRLALDIRAQSASLARVLDQHCGAGRAPLREAADLLRSSARVVIVGIGASLNAAIPFENLLCSHGIKSCSVEAGGVLHHP